MRCNTKQRFQKLTVKTRQNEGCCCFGCVFLMCGVGVKDPRRDMMTRFREMSRLVFRHTNGDGDCLIVSERDKRTSIRPSL